MQRVCRGRREEKQHTTTTASSVAQGKQINKRRFSLSDGHRRRRPTRSQKRVIDCDFSAADKHILLRVDLCIGFFSLFRIEEKPIID